MILISALTQFGTSIMHWLRRLLRWPFAGERRGRRWWGWRLLLGVVLIFVLRSETLLPAQDFHLQLGGIIYGERFDWAGWVATTWLEEAGRYVDPQVTPSAGAGGEQVLIYLAQQDRLRALQAEAEAAYAQLANPPSEPLPPYIRDLETQIEALQIEQANRIPKVERILTWQVSQVLADEGFDAPLGLWPPLSFRLVTPPSYLIISPRDEIRMEYATYLTPNLPDSERSHLEAEIEARFDVSALVDNVGGISSWPTVVTTRASLISLIDIIAHEWNHNYMVFHPLGQHYSASRDLTVINETVASIFGHEVARSVLARYYPEHLPPPTPPPPPIPATPPPPNPDAPETFAEAMRRIRLHVDDLLAQGHITEAEAFMEAERQKLVAKGYNLRRLNQAYFAFHGNYATSPASVDPIGPALRQLRAEQASLKDFIDLVAPITSGSDLQRVLEENGLTPIDLAAN